MKSNSPKLNSSRAGRFKKKLVDLDQLFTEAPIIKQKISPFNDLFISKQITQVEFTAAYLITYLSHRFPITWLGSENKNNPKIPGIFWKDLPFQFESRIIKRLSKDDSLLSLFNHFNFKSTPKSVNRTITEWAEGNYKLQLLFRIPNPREVLEMQKMGVRCVTTIIDDQISNYILGERDALSFTMHDLIHADHFFFENDCFLGQLGFYGLLNKTYSFFDLGNSHFSNEFNYLIADMNAYAIHLLKCLKSAMIYYFNEKYFIDWLNLLDNPPKSILLLNTASYDPQCMDKEILDWLQRYVEV